VWTKVSVGDGRNGERTGPERLRAVEKLAEVTIRRADGGEKGGPAAEFVQHRTADDKAEICGVVFNE